MMQSPSILFVCSGNIFRSMTAEYALKALPAVESSASVASAVLEQAPHEVIDFVSAHLIRRGIDVSGHRPRRLTESLLRGAELAVAMGFDHRDQIRTRFGRHVPLFSEVAYAEERTLPDVWEVVPDWQVNLDSARRYAEEVMDYIVEGMPSFNRRMNGFFAGSGPWT